MNRRAVAAIVRKDLTVVLRSKAILIPMIVVPLVMLLILPLTMALSVGVPLMIPSTTRT